jgi:hypothetical protein
MGLHVRWGGGAVPTVLRSLAIKGWAIAPPIRTSLRHYHSTLILFLFTKNRLIQKKFFVRVLTKP